MKKLADISEFERLQNSTQTTSDMSFFNYAITDVMRSPNIDRALSSAAQTIMGVLKSASENGKWSELEQKNQLGFNGLTRWGEMLRAKLWELSPLNSEARGTNDPFWFVRKWVEYEAGWPMAVNISRAYRQRELFLSDGSTYTLTAQDREAMKKQADEGDELRLRSRRR